MRLTQYKYPPLRETNRRNLISTGAAIALAVAGAAAAGATAYSTTVQQKTASNEKNTAQAAIQAQQAVGLAQIEAPIKAETAAAEAAKAKLKLKQAASTTSILTPPGGLQAAQVTEKSILGV